MTNTNKIDLYDRVINRINYEHKIQVLKRKILANSCGLFISLIIFIPALSKLYSEIIQSGLVQFVSLIFTDFKMITLYFNDYILSIIESIPVMSFFAALFILSIALFTFSKLFISFLEMKSLLYLNHDYKNI